MTRNSDRSPQPSIVPPIAEKRPKRLTLHGETRIDDYYWLREKDNPEVLAYLQAENAYSDAVMKPTEPLQKVLYEEILSHIKETDLSVPYRKGDYLYYARTEEGQQYAIRCRRRDSMDAGEEVLLDLNEMSASHSFLGLGAFEVSDDGDWLAYSMDTTGYRQFTLHVKNLRTGEILSEAIERTGAVAWDRDNRTFYYTTEHPVTKRSDQVHRHVVGESGSDLLYEEEDETFSVWLHRTRDRRFLLVGSGSSTSTEVRTLPLGDPGAKLRILAPREKDHEYDVDHGDGLFYIRTNKGAKNFRLVTAPDTDPDPTNWEEYLPYRPEIKTDSIHVFAGHCVIEEWEKGQRQIRIVDRETRRSHRIRFPEKVFAAAVMDHHLPEYDTGTLRLSYQSMVTPESVYDYEMADRKRTLLKQTDVPGYDPSRYVTKRVHAAAPDGTLVPMSLVYRKGRKRNGRGAALLSGYGSYGAAISPGFSTRNIILLDRGVMVGIAHPRGGGELGEEWRDEGRMKKKLNTFTDFIACAKHLIAEGYVSPERLAISGGSAGGLLMGAVTNLRPDLFTVVLAHVPFVDVLTTMLDDSLPLTTSEYEEWGNPNKRDEYEVIRAYSPYDNIASKEYPIMLIRVSLNDSQVPYWEGAKFAAKLRAMKTDDRLLLLRTNLGAGHGGASGRYDALRDVAFDTAFVLTNLGIAR